MKKILIQTLLVVCLPAVPLTARPAATLHDFAHVGDGGGVRTVFTVVNRTSSPASLEISFFTDEGEPFRLQIGEVEASTFDFEVASLGTLQFSTAGENSTARQGWARMTSNVAVGAQASFEISTGDGLATRAAVDTTTPLRSFDFPIEVNPETDTGVAIANPSSFGPLIVVLTLTDSSGTVIQQESIEIPASGHTAQFATQFLELGGEQVSGQMNVTGSGPFAFTILQQSGLILGNLPRITPLF